MIELRVYLYDQNGNGYRGEDLTPYLLQGGENTEDLTQELDITNITLMGLTRAERFVPTTKFIIDACENGEVVYSYHRLVKDDLVEKVILNEDYYKHSITLLEASADAQKRLCDNMSVTYKLKDVSLATKITYDLDTPNGSAINEFNYEPSYNFGKTQINVFNSITTYGKNFKYENNIKVKKSTEKDFKDLKYIEITNDNGENVEIEFPKLKIYGGVKDTKNFEYIGDASLYYKIEEYNLDGSISNENFASGEIISNSDFSNHNYDWNQKYDYSDYSLYKKEYLIEEFGRSQKNPDLMELRVLKYSNINSTPNYILPLRLYKNKKYNIKLQLYKFVQENLIGNLQNYIGDNRILFTQGKWDWLWGYRNDSNYQVSIAPENIYTQEAEIVTYENDEVQEVLSSGLPYTASNLIKKAILNTYVGQKQDGISSVDLMHQNNNGEFDLNCPYYIDPQYQPELDNTVVVENFYNQKNLWEVLVEVGYYIHAVPEIVFGENGKFMITFTRLGGTTENANENTPIAIYNFGGIDDYIAETSSYVTNMVQLGGSIEELIVPKNSSESYTTSNETAELKVSRPIIELLKLEVTCNSDSYSDLKIDKDDTADITSYIYEKNVYQLLPIDRLQLPNKGTCIYYELGSNKIVGCNYQLPQASPNIFSDYSLKKVIYMGLLGGSYPTSETAPTSGYWTTIKVNDFSFKVTYRTKDEVRLNHSRPDLRKYLLNTPFDKVPKLQQFNNQQDVLVDSEKFGSNIYGTLIRTGNNNYETQEWVDSIFKLKQKGEIVRINGEIYYVAKIKNTFFANHIDSNIEYSKDYNQLSKVIGIPSEPRFYEISEQSSISREVAINDYLQITTSADNIKTGNIKTFEHLNRLVFGNETETDFAKYVLTTFKGDDDIGAEGQTFGVRNHRKDILTPLNAFSSGNTLTYSWQMVDNYSAGDKVINIEEEEEDQIDAVKSAYTALQAVKYCDQYGKATLFDFYILEELSQLTFNQIKNLPESPYDTKPKSPDDPTPSWRDGLSILAERQNNILLKDCREQISFNYNIQAITDSDRFVTSPYLFAVKDNCYVAFLSEEVNKLSNGTINTATIIGTPQLATRVVETDKIIIDFSGLTIPENCKAVALVYDYDLQTAKTKFAIARNIVGETSLTDWYLGILNETEVFSKNNQEKRVG